MLPFHGDPHFLFYKFNENNILNNWEKKWQKSVATFLANEISATERDIAGPTEQVQIMFPLKDKIIQGIWRYFLWDVWMNKQWKKVELFVILTRRTGK